MRESEERRCEFAAAAGEEEIGNYAHDTSPRVVRAVLTNKRLTENDALVIAQRKNLPADILESLAKDVRFTESYPIRLALARNPKAPLSVSLSIVRHLRIFDLEEITRSHFIPLVFRHKVEAIIAERIPAMPLGNKKTLARKAVGAILLKLLQDRDLEIVQLCLNNPRLTEAHIIKVLTRRDTAADTIRMIGEHPNWSTRSLVRLALTRHMLTPLPLSVRFIHDMKLLDLQELYADPSVPVTIKPFLHSELLERGVEPSKAVQDRIFEINEEELAEIDAEEAIPDFEEDERRNGRSVTNRDP